MRFIWSLSRFQIAFITAHFPAYIRDIGIGARYAVIALALVGFFNIIGSLASGAIGQRYSKPIFLALIYVARSAAMTAFLLLPQAPASVIIFAIVMGLLWLSTVPPTNSLVAIMFGTRHLSLLGGVVFLSHQIGSFLGVWLGGYLYDRFHSYDPVWWLGVALGLFAAVVHWPIRERPVERGRVVPAGRRRRAGKGTPRPNRTKPSLMIERLREPPSHDGFQTEGLKNVSLVPTFLCGRSLAWHTKMCDIPSNKRR